MVGGLHTRTLLILLAAMHLASCGSARMGDRESDRLFQEGKYDEAVAHLEAGLKDQGDNGRDLLLYVLDLGLTQHSAGKYDESNRYFLQADKIAEIKDYTSLSTEGATAFTSDNIKDYKGEDFEKVLINTYLATNYACLGNFEDALVEARRVNQKLYRMVNEGERKYKQNAFARYLSAVLYEATGDFNNALVDYKKTKELVPEMPGLGKDLWRMAYALRMTAEMSDWKAQYNLSDADQAAAKRLLKSDQLGEVIVLYENGLSPVKVPNPNFSSIPMFKPRNNPFLSARVEVSGSPSGETFMLHNIEQVAIENLDEKYAALIAKKIAGVVATELIGNQVEERTHSPLLGILTRVALYASNQADVRSWYLLPHDLQLLRLPLEPGTYSIKVNPVGGSALPEKSVQIQAGKKVFLSFRSIPS